MRVFYLIATIVLLTSCNPDKNRIVNRNEPKFKTTDASRLFFKNVRLLYYDLEEKNEGKIQVLKLGRRIEDSTEAIINVYIINNWFQDRAYPMISLSPYFNDIDTLNIEMLKEDGSTELLEFNKTSSMNEQFYFASAIYEGLLRKYSFKLLNEDKALFTNSDQREAFRITMVDFYRLVGIY
ncbi:hypothetical protein HZR84_07960 [Hyphobacterium sp. CCMP332]|nr:hypothetical protein HZR84_07960 [Hyphobacterium sp. CCMP332]